MIRDKILKTLQRLFINKRVTKKKKQRVKSMPGFAVSSHYTFQKIFTVDGAN